MAEQQTAPVAPTTAATSEANDAAEAEGTESAVELREALIDRLRENRASREKPEKGDKPAKPKRGEPEPKQGDDAANADDSPEVAKYKAERRSFAKAKRKFEANAATRESNIVAYERRTKEELALFERDPVAWLKARKADVRGTLLKMANEDAEDPRDKKLRELEDSQKADKAEREREKAEKAERDTKAQQATAVTTLQTELTAAWSKAEVDDYPTVAALLEPNHVAERACEIMLDHYRKTRKELAPSAVFAIMEDELAPLKGKLANPKKRTPPEPARAVSASRKAAIPETPPKRERSSKDVTRSVTREPTNGRPLNFDRDSLRARLVEKAREAAR